MPPCPRLNTDGRRLVQMLQSGHACRQLLLLHVAVMTLGLASLSPPLSNAWSRARAGTLGRRRWPPDVADTAACWCDAAVQHTELWSSAAGGDQVVQASCSTRRAS